MKRTFSYAMTALALSTSPMFAQEPTPSPYAQAEQTMAPQTFVFVPASVLGLLSHQQCQDAGQRAAAGGAVLGVPFVFLPKITPPPGVKAGDAFAVQMEGTVWFEVASPYVPAQADKVMIDTFKLTRIDDADG